MESDDAGLTAACAAWRDADPAHDAAFWRAWTTWSGAGRTAIAADESWRAEAAALRSGWRPRARRWIWIAAPVGLAASVALALGIPNLTRPAAIEIATRVAETRVVALADGSRVTVGGRSGIEARVDATGRRVELARGQAFFEVAHDPARPFVVVAGDAEITVRGTRFDVRLVGDDVQVSVLEGKVEVRRRGLLSLLSAGAPDAVLTGGQKSELAPQAGAFAPAAPAATVPGEWRSGRLYYADAPLSEILADAARYSAARIEASSPAIGAMSLTMSYRAGDDEGLRHAIEAALPVRVEKRGTVWMVDGAAGE
nr:FecR domain-containing protein [Sphingomonas colocasiae]